VTQAGHEPDHYTTLGVEADAPRREIERRYKRLAAEHHPDRGGDEERMKTLNEAYRVLRDDTRRAAYDAARAEAPGARGGREFVPATSPSATADALWGRMVGAILSIFGGTVLLCLVRFQYVVFLWPLALLGFAVMIFGVWMAHAAIAYARQSLAPTHLARRTAWVQEAAFFSVVAGGLYGLYLVLTTL
jgi:curved DNA-binding protein CbpA